MRKLCTVGALLLLAAPATSQASEDIEPKPKPVCNLLVDAVGDARLVVIDMPGLDIVSADVASGPSTVVTVIRVRSLGGTEMTTGGTWEFTWKFGTASYGTAA